MKGKLFLINDTLNAIPAWFLNQSTGNAWQCPASQCLWEVFFNQTMLLETVRESLLLKQNQFQKIRFWLPGNLYFLQPPVLTASCCDLNLCRLPTYADRDCFTVGWAAGPCRDALWKYFTPSTACKWAKTQNPEPKPRMVHVKLLECRLKQHTDWTVRNQVRLRLQKGQIKKHLPQATSISGVLLHTDLQDNQTRILIYEIMFTFKILKGGPRKRLLLD